MRRAWSNERKSSYAAWLASATTRSRRDWGRNRRRWVRGGNALPSGEWRGSKTARARANRRRCPPDLRQRLLRQLEAPPPKGFSGWDGGSLAAALGVSDDAVWRILRKDGIQLRRQRSWCVSTDPQFAAKAADIVGLYLRSPAQRSGGVRRREALDPSFAT